MLKRWFWPICTVMGMAVYWPALTAVFGLHNDYSFLNTVRGDIFGFVESKQGVIIGRLIGSILLTLQGWTTATIADFTVWRWISFGFTILNSFLLVRFLQSFVPLRRSAAWLFFVMCVTVPAAVVQIIWVADVFNSAVDTALAITSYLLFNRAFQRPSDFVPVNRRRLAGAFVVLWMSFWIYFPSACMFLALTVLQLLFRKQPVVQMRRMMVRDIGFFAGTVVFYFIFDRLFLKWLIAVHLFLPPQAVNNAYALTLTNLWIHKLPMLWDSYVLSYKGIWNFLGTRVSGLFIAAEAVVLALCWFARPGRGQEGLLVFLEKMAWMALVVLITQSPAVAASGFFYVVGYRVLSCSTFVICFAKFYVLTAGGQDQDQRGLKVALWIVLAAFMGIVCAVKVAHVVTIRKAELLQLESAVNRINRMDHIQTLIVTYTPRELDLKDKDLPSELGLMMCLYQHWKPAFDVLSRQEGFPPKKLPEIYEQPPGWKGIEYPGVVTMDLDVN